MKRRLASSRWLGFGLLAASLLLPAPSRAERDREREPGDDAAQVVQLLEQDTQHLDPETLAAVRDIAARAQRRWRNLSNRRRAERAVLHGLLSVEPPDAAAVMRQADVLAALDAELLRERVRVILEFRKRLTPEQLATLGTRTAEVVKALAPRPECSGDKREAAPRP